MLHSHGIIRVLQSDLQNIKAKTCKQVKTINNNNTTNNTTIIIFIQYSSNKLIGQMEFKKVSF